MFCGSHGRLTKEHAWPQWLGRGTTVGPEEHTHTSGFGRTGGDTLTEHPNRAVHRRATVLTTFVREVCATCNNEWMSQLEERARPLLERLWASGYPLGATAFSEVETSALAAWATKTAWVRERAGDHSNVADDATRHRFACSPTVPELTTVWVARHDGRANFQALSAGIEVTRSDRHWTSGESRRVHLCTLVFRGLAFLVRTDSGPGVAPMRLPTDAWRQLAPHAGTLLWPPVRPVSDIDVNIVTRNVGAWLRMPPTTQFVRSGDWQHVQRN